MACLSCVTFCRIPLSSRSPPSLNPVLIILAQGTLSDFKKNEVCGYAGVTITLCRSDSHPLL